MVNSLLLDLAAFGYQKGLRPFLFRFDAEKVHTTIVSLGATLGKNQLFLGSSPSLSQTIAKIEFSGPIGLAAGFDYEARLTQTLPFLGFGFETVGTITNLPYAGNLRPRLGRLPKSQSLMVNKGFKNPGADKIIAQLSPLDFVIPLGISLGSPQAQIVDIVTAFEKFEQASLKHSYYELNISCPNLKTHRDFYSSLNLNALLKAIDRSKISRPIFVKMPISKTDEEILRMLEVISSHCPKGVILGNLQKDRHHPNLHPDEVGKFSVGNFSGLPTQKRSNELISLAYQRYQKRFIIIGCGGVFSANDAYEKICLGASLVQLITGLIFQGPQLVLQINQGLTNLLKRNGFKNISEAVGTRA